VGQQGEEAIRSMLPGVQALEAHQHTLFKHLKTSFSAEI